MRLTHQVIAENCKNFLQSNWSKFITTLICQQLGRVQFWLLLEILHARKMQIIPWNLDGVLNSVLAWPENKVQFRDQQISLLFPERRFFVTHRFCGVIVQAKNYEVDLLRSPNVSLKVQ